MKIVERMEKLFFIEMLQVFLSLLNGILDSRLVELSFD